VPSPNVVVLSTQDPFDTEPAPAAIGSGATFSVTFRSPSPPTGWTITPSGGPGQNLPSSGFTVLAGSATKTVVVLPGQSLVQGFGISGTPIGQTAGQPFNATAFAVDQFFNIDTTRSDVVGFFTSDPFDTSPLPEPLASGQKTLIVTPRTKSAVGWTVTPFGGIGALVPSSAYPVAGSPATQMHILLPGEIYAEGAGRGGSPIVQTGGTPFAVTILIVDNFFNIDTSINANLPITHTDPGGAYPASVIVAAGALTFNVTPGTATATGWTLGAVGAACPGVGPGVPCAPATSTPYLVNPGPTPTPTLTPTITPTVTATPTATATPIVPTLQLLPPIASEGQTFAINGSNFLPNEVVTLTIDAVSLGPPIAASGAGAFSYVTSVPVGTSLGSHPVNGSGDLGTNATRALNVVAPPTNLLFTLRSGSAQVVPAPGATFVPADILAPPASPSAAVSVVIACGSLGLTCSGGSLDDIRALSTGSDWIAGWLDLRFAVPGAAGQGVAGSAVAAEGAGAANDVFAAKPSVRPSATGGNVLTLHGGGASAYPSGVSAGSTIDGLAAGTPASVYFTLAAGSPSLGSLPGGPFSAADVFRVTPGPSPVVSLYASRSALGLQAGDVIGDICLREDGVGGFALPANNPAIPGDRLLFSLASGSPTLSAIGATPGDLLRPASGGPPIRVVLASRYGLTASATTNGIACAQPPIPNSACPDLTGNGNVGFDDLLRLATTYGATPSAPAWDPVNDLDLDSSVDFGDLLRLAALYGTACVVPNPGYLP